MPVYEYQCGACGHRFDKLYRTLSQAQAASSPPCPACGADEAQRALSSFSMGGPGGPDPGEVAAQRQQAERETSIAPKSMIEDLRRGKP